MSVIRVLTGSSEEESFTGTLPVGVLRRRKQEVRSHEKFSK